MCVPRCTAQNVPGLTKSLTLLALSGEMSSPGLDLSDRGSCQHQGEQPSHCDSQ